MDHDARVLRIDRYAPSVAIVRVIKDGAVAILLGTVILRAAENQRVGAWMLIDAFELGDAHPRVEAVGPRLPSVGRPENATVGSGINDLRIRRIERESMMIGVNVLPDVARIP